VPDARSGEPGDHLDAQLRGRTRGVLHALGGALAHALRVAVAPHLGRQHALMARVDRVAHRLADEVGADRPAVEPVAFKNLAPVGAVPGVGEGGRDVEVVAPAGELEPVELPLAALGGEDLE
jgi:hypothetical protein